MAHTKTTELITELHEAEKALQLANAARQKAIITLAAHIQARLRLRKIDRGTMSRRLGVKHYVLGNFFHLHQRLKDDILLELANEIEIPMTPAEKERQKKQTCKTLI